MAWRPGRLWTIDKDLQAILAEPLTSIEVKAGELPGPKNRVMVLCSPACGQNGL